MNTSEEEQTADDSEAAGGGKAVHAVRGNTAIDLNLASQEKPTERAYLRIELEPIQADRILSMVEREQDYEKQAARAGLWLSIITTFIASVLGVTGIIVILVLIAGPHQRSQWQWQVVSLSLASIVSAVVGYAARGAWLSIYSWRSKASHGPRRDMSDD